MSLYHTEIRVTPRPGLLDPQGKAIQHALDSLGFPGVEEVRVGKVIVIDLAADSPEDALAIAEAMCAKLLANPVTEDFVVDVQEAAAGAGATL